MLCCAALRGLDAQCLLFLHDGQPPHVPTHKAALEGEAPNGAVRRRVLPGLLVSNLRGAVGTEALRAVGAGVRLNLMPPGSLPSVASGRHKGPEPGTGRKNQAATGPTALLPSEASFDSPGCAAYGHL